MTYAKDFYPTLTALKRDLVRNKHYRTKVVDRGAEITVIAPHGGFIEPGSSYIARGVAGHNYNLYDFQGLRRRQAEQLHITSTRFRDRKLSNLLGHTRTAVSIHSMGDEAFGEIWVGGLNLVCKKRICEQLVLQGFVVNPNSPRYRGVHPANVVNLAQEHGVQIELSADVISSMFVMKEGGLPFGRRVTVLPTTERYQAFVSAIRSALVA